MILLRAQTHRRSPFLVHALPWHFGLVGHRGCTSIVAMYIQSCGGMQIKLVCPTRNKSCKAVHAVVIVSSSVLFTMGQQGRLSALYLARRRLPCTRWLWNLDCCCNKAGWLGCPSGRVESLSRGLVCHARQWHVPFWQAAIASDSYSASAAHTADSPLYTAVCKFI